MGSHALLQGIFTPGIKPASPASLALAGRFFTTSAPREACNEPACLCTYLLVYLPAKLFQLCPTLQPMDCSPPGSSVLGILRERILEWIAKPSCRASSRPRAQTCVSYVSCIGRWVLYK